MAYTLVTTCYGCGATLRHRVIPEPEALNYARNIKELGAQLGRVEPATKRIIMYDGFCPDCNKEVFSDQPLGSN